jgi:peptidoglycan hydrolase CwlO-like protein
MNEEINFSRKISPEKRKLYFMYGFLAIMFIFLAYLYFNNKTLIKKLSERYKEDIEKLSSTINEAEKRVDTFEVQYSDVLDKIENLKSELNKNVKTLNNEKAKINELNEKFKTLPNSVRDSILHEFIRSNQ